MSPRLQTVVTDEEAEEVRKAAKRSGLPLSAGYPPEATGIEIALTRDGPGGSGRLIPMKRTSWSNPKGIGFSEMLLCPDSVFAKVFREIGAGHVKRARALLQLTACLGRPTLPAPKVKRRSR